ncbi:fused MFS/spermidine synthase [Roseinatronobacter alkalisoli]|uniref:Fused MFS/spermidine synthase n=1 Tax=Roseinatronobacter alkalisoli TaxID=3028235 RepID=A0ABT5T572_9RHOB|nr:fused MFS/spermidine synthase [Roseinatronobacter sp. HJB301]MDD7970258.1 fused MFS/spermidine synthase [Roseinatronobacter sp. HJB301]
MTRTHSPRHIAALGALFTLSGAAALIYQVLWVRELGLLFGSTAQAAALTIAIFFTGIALGGWLFGRVSGRLARPLRAFGWVEAGVAATALGHFLVADAYFTLYPALYAMIGGIPVLETALKAGVAGTILLPSAILMGGTLPLMGQHVIRAQDSLGRMGSALYALNTAGGAMGALAAGFFLPIWLGFSGAYLLAVGFDLVVGLSALFLARRALPVVAQNCQPRVAIPARLWIIAFASGFATLAVEVIWTRAFAQVLQNSVYTYALVLTVFLLALSLGAGLANGLNRTALRPDAVLTGLLLAAAAVVAATPHLFHHLTGGLGYLGGRADFAGYVWEVGRVAVLTMLIPGTILGAVLPYLLRLMEGGAPGAVLGRLIAVNTTGAIFGALAGGFVLLPMVGAWKGLWLMGAVYAVLVLALWQPSDGWGARIARFAGLAGVVVLLAGQPGLQAARLNTAEELLAFREGASAHVAVVAREESKFIRVNNFYTLGGSGALVPERNQTMIPLLTHPSPREIFFLGLGTGISAGAGLFANPDRVTVCELLPDVIDFARDWFGPYVNGLFDDPRVTIHPEDGRQCLARSRATYDMIIADLFTPWRAGVGNVYTAEHYRLAASRLNAGGAYVQWMPLYQVSRREFEIVANTMVQAFPEVTIWRGDLYPERSIVALVGRKTPAPLDPATLAAQWRAMTGSDEPDDVLSARALKFYAGNAASGLFADAPVNTDDLPLIEYLAPRTHRAVIAGRANWLTGPERDRFYTDLLDALPPGSDPHLALLTPAQRNLARAGAVYAEWRGLRTRNDLRAGALWQDFLALTPSHARDPDSPAGQVAIGGMAFGEGAD